MPSDLFEINSNPLLNAHIGPAMLFVAPFGTTFPTSISDVINLGGLTPWVPKTGWTSIGATKTGIKPGRGFTKVDRMSDQSFGAYDSRPNNWTATVSTEMLETTPTNLSLAWEGSPVSIDSAAHAVLSSASIAAGAATFTVPNGSGIVASDVVLVDVNGLQEWVSVQSVIVGTMGAPDSITLTTGEVFAYAHASGVSVIRPGQTSVGFGRPQSLTPRLLAIVAPLISVSVADKGSVTALRMWAYRFVRLGDGAKEMTLTQENDWTLPVTFNCYRDTTVADQLSDTFKVFDMTIS